MDDNAKRESVRVYIPEDFEGPEKIILEKLGFCYIREENSNYVKATLPIGWSLGATYTQDETCFPGETFRSFYDDKKQHRGRFFSYRKYGTIFNANIELFPRYKIIIINQGVHVRDNSNGQYITVGEYKYFYELFDLIEMTEEYLQDNYPEWKDVTAYWT